VNAWRTQLVAVVLAALLGTLYAVTMPPGPTFGDGLEFASVVHVLGIPHPTGYPLYTMLGRLWELAVPIHTVAWRLHLLSAVFGVAAALFLFGAVREALRDAGKEWEQDPQPHRWRRVLIPGGAALAWGLTPAVWQVANITEVYTLFAVFLHVLAWLMLWNLRCRRGWADWIIALLFGLSLTHHRLIIVLVPALIGYAIARIRAVRAAPPRGGRALWIALVLVALCVGLSPIAYLPLRGAMNPPIVWGEPTTAEGLMWILRGGEFVQTQLLADRGNPWPADQIVPRITGRATLVLTMMLGEFIPMMMRTVNFAYIMMFSLTLLMAVGWWRSRFALRWALPTVAFLNLAIVSVYSIADFQPYLLPLVSVGWFWLAIGLLWASERLEDYFFRRRFTYTPLVLGLLPLWLGLRFFSLCDRSSDERADTWATGILEALEPNALLLTRQDGDTFAMWYAQQVDGVRPDVTVFGTNFMWSPWYREFFSPEEAGRLHFEDIGGPPSADYYLIALVGGLLAPNLEADRPVYATFNLYESDQHHLASIWPVIFQGEYYEIVFLGHTRDVEASFSVVAPPHNPLLLGGFARAMRDLGEPAPQLYRIVDNPRLTSLAFALRDEFLEDGFQAYQRRLSSPVNTELPVDQLISPRGE
jgi:hypothetical protein